MTSFGRTLATLILIPAVVALGGASAPTFSAENAPAEVSHERTGVTDTEINLGSCLPFTGALKERAEQVNLGATTYFDYINSEAGINGRKIKFKSCDDGFDPNKAIPCFNSCVKDNVFAGFLFLGSAPIVKYVRMGEAQKMPLLGFCTGTPAVYDFHPTEFTIRPSYSDEVSAMVDHLCKIRKLTKIAVIYQDDAFGAGIREGANKKLAEYHLTPVVEASYPRNAVEINEAFERVHKANPEAVILGATSDRLMEAIKRKKRENWQTTFVAFSVGVDYLAEGGKDADGTIVAQTWPLLEEKLPTLSLYNKLRKKFTPNAKPNQSALEGMINSMYCCEALKRAGKDLTRTKFIAALESMHGFDLGLGPNYKLNFSKTNHNGLSAKAVYFTMLQNGQFIRMTDADWKKLKV
jgi:branched-chain amino acid transport system substrate-binding protein